MELVLFTIIFTITGMLVCMGVGYIVGTIQVEDVKTDIPDDELAEKIRKIKVSGLSPSQDDQLYLEEAAQRLENTKEDSHDQESGRG